MSSDPDLTRLRALANESRIELDAGARERLARSVAEQGPQLVRRAHRVRQAGRAGAVVVALGAALVIARMRDGAARDDTLAARPSTATLPAATSPAADAASAPARACAARPALPSLRLDQGEAGAQRVALGAAGLVVADAGTTMWLDAHDACRLRVRLLDGKVSVHAGDLGGGELRVATPSGEVLVHGTTFAVALRKGELTVDVHEGRVSVARHGTTLSAALSAGQRLRVANTTQTAVVEPLPANARAALLAALADTPEAEAAAAEPEPEPTPPVTTTPQPASASRAAGPEARSVESLVDEAEALWRAGQVDRARARFRQAGALRGPTAEAAWLALARRELTLDRLDAAQSALDARAARFGKGSLDGEAAGIAFRVALRAGDDERIRRRAEYLQKSYPTSPQGQSAAQWLSEHPRR